MKSTGAGMIFLLLVVTQVNSREAVLPNSCSRQKHGAAHVCQHPCWDRKVMVLQSQNVATARLG